MKSNIQAKTVLEINAPAARVWEALVKPELVKKYLFGTNVHTDWKVGSPIYFRGEWEGTKYEDKGTLLEVQENSVLKYDYYSSMSPLEDKPENYMIISFLLSEDKGKTTLTCIQENVADEKTKEHSQATWQMVLNTMKEIVEGK